MSVTITKGVRPNATWQEMYLQIQKGQRVLIASEGLWSPEIHPATILWCGPDGIEAISATLNEETDTLEDMVEPFLLKIGFIQRTRKGRVVGEKAYEHLGIEAQPGSQESLFKQ